MGVRDLFSVPPIPQDGDTDYDRAVRARELYNRELRKGVELGRKLGAFESRFGKLRTHVTDVCATLILKGGFPPNSEGVLVLRNAVRIMKGKNKL